MGDGLTIAERKARYDNSALKQFMEANGHTTCDRCYCCDSMSESVSCWQCGGGFPDQDYDGWLDICSVCKGEGELYYMVCVGSCDDNGNHKS